MDSTLEALVYRAIEARRQAIIAHNAAEDARARSNELRQKADEAGGAMERANNDLNKEICRRCQPVQHAEPNA